MGSFGYICKGCGTSIRGNSLGGGEKTVMIHVRHGKELGRVEGHYDEFGRVIEQESFSETQKFRGNSDEINGHKEICSSEFNESDSFYRLNDLRIYKDKEFSYFNFIRERMEEEVKKYEEDITQSHFFKHLDKNRQKLITKQIESGQTNKANYLFTAGNEDFGYTKSIIEYNIFYKKLPTTTREHYSGIVAWHSACYKKASEDERKDLTPSKSDPNQSWGNIRKKYS